MSEHEDALKDAFAGIKTKRTRRRIAKYNPEDGLLLDIEEGKVYVPGKGIVQVHEVKEKILDCNHSSRFGLGHIDDHGHTVCVLCVEKYRFECAKPGCFKKLCTVRGCSCCARDIDNVLFCKRHAIWARIDSFAFLVFMKRDENIERLNAMNIEYYSRRLQLRPRNEAERK